MIPQARCAEWIGGNSPRTGKHDHGQFSNAMILLVLPTARLAPTSIRDAAKLALWGSCRPASDMLQMLWSTQHMVGGGPMSPESCHDLADPGPQIRQKSSQLRPRPEQRPIPGTIWPSSAKVDRILFEHIRPAAVPNWGRSKPKVAGCGQSCHKYMGPKQAEFWKNALVEVGRRWPKLGQSLPMFERI